jgi:aldehyde:ferredoxin oxidoreductase
MLYVESLYAIGMMALLNWKTIYWPPVAEIYAQKFWDRAWAKSKGCFSCSMHCSHFYSIRDGPFAGTYGEGPEYEAACAFGAKAGANNVDAVCYANNLVNQYGLDVIDAGNAISAAMEWFEKGIITEKDTGGIRIEWGDVDVIVKLIHMMAKREGFGDLLAEGAYFAAQKIGKNADYYVIQCKGLGYEACDRRGFKGSALSHGVATRGADHMRSSPALEFGGVPLKVKREQIADAFEKYVASRDLFQYAANPREYRGKPHLVKFYEHMYCVVDCLGLCKFGFSRWPDTNIYPEDHAALYSTATGIDVTWKELYQMAERVYNLERAFIVREGVTRAHDMPPERWVKEPTDAPWCKGEVIDLEKYNQMLDEYYELRGWDKNGVPTRKKLEELNLGYVADHMENLTIPRSTQFLTIGIKRE